MATVRIRRGKKRSERWVADYRDQHGIRRIEAPAGDFGNKVQEKLAAKALLDKRLAEINRGQYVPSSQRPTVGEACRQLLSSKVNLRPSTRRDYESLVNLYVVPRFGDKKVQALRPEDIEQFRAELLKGLPPAVAAAFAARLLAASPKWSQARARQQVGRKKPGFRTINKVLTLISMLLAFCCQRGWCDYNAAEHVEHIKTATDLNRGSLDDNILTPDEVRRLLEVLPDNVHRLVIVTALFTGARQGELLGLRWDDVDLQSQQIHVQRAWRERSFTLPKTRSSVRKIELPDFLALELKKWKLRCPKNEFDLVFPSAAGRPLSPSNLVNRTFHPALKRAGINRRIRFHDLRHTCASLMLARGEDVLRVSRVLGHATANVTLGTYAHMLPNKSYGTANRLAEFIFGNSAAPTSPASAAPVVVEFPSSPVGKAS